MSELKAGVIKTSYGEGFCFVVNDVYYDCDEYETKFYLKSDADKVIADLKADKLTLMQRLNVLDGKFFGLSQSHNIEISKCGSLERLVTELKAENKRLDDLAHAHNLELLQKENCIEELNAKADKLLSCLKCLVMRDLIKDCPEKESAIEIVKEYK